MTEFDIDEETHRQITKLKNSCFPDYTKPRSYYKQLPHFRYLAYQGQTLIGQMGIDHRAIAIEDSVFTIFGVIDLCVIADKRRLGIASQMLQSLTQLAQEKSIDFLFAVASDHRLYQKNEFSAVIGYFQWLRIHDHKNYGVANEKLDQEVLVKQIGHRKWSDGPVDLLGYLF
ncbi:MAG: GNAT family N-acetyltransferase [Cyanophyceae cyanobacterium]